MKARGNRDGPARIAAQVITAYKMAGPPLSLDNLCAAAGIGVFVRRFDYVAGVFIRDDIFPVIIVNGRDDPARRRFTIAHELGHYFLSHRRGSFAEPARATGQERDAEKFAACLLMPEPWVREHWRAYAGNAANRSAVLAELFDVSAAALAVRVKELNLTSGAAGPR